MNAKLRLWKQQIRRRHLRQNPLCEVCLRRNKIAAAEIVRHVGRHVGASNVVRFSKYQSMCKACYDDQR
jgi:hypothetical protein